MEISQAQQNSDIKVSTTQKSGTFVMPIFRHPKTGDVGVIAADEMICDNRKQALQARKSYEYRLRKLYGLVPANKYLTIELPKEQGKYPIVYIKVHGASIPFAPLSGPIYDKQKAGTLFTQK